MSFRKFLSEIKSVREYERTGVDVPLINEIKEYLNRINSKWESEGGFSFELFENGSEIFEGLKGIGGYSGVMIESPHYIGFFINAEEIKTEFFGAYYMQSIVKKLYELDLDHCWINIRNVSGNIKNNLFNEHSGNINYLLAFGKSNEKPSKQKSSLHVQSGESYKTNPYGASVTEVLDNETCRLGVEEIVYLYKWGQKITYEELENRGLADLFLYVRNAPSYKNKQPNRFIIQDGEAHLAVINPKNKENITDCGIMLYTIVNMAKDLGIPSKWSYTGVDEEMLCSAEHAVLAKIEL